MSNKPGYKRHYDKQTSKPTSNGSYKLKLCTLSIITFTSNGISLVIPAKKRDSFTQSSFKIADKKRNAFALSENTQWKRSTQNNYINHCKERYENEYIDHLIHITKHRLSGEELEKLGSIRIGYYQKIMNVLFEIIKEHLKSIFEIPSESFEYLKTLSATKQSVS